MDTIKTEAYKSLLEEIKTNCDNSRHPLTIQEEVFLQTGFEQGINFLIEEQKKRFDNFFNKKIIISKGLDDKMKILRKKLFGGEKK